MKLNPYITFSGNGEEALNFYLSALGGKLLQLSRYAESPMQVDESWKQKILHARFVFDDNLVMISDSSQAQPTQAGDNIQLSVDVETTEQLEIVFNKMAEGGAVKMPLQDTFWGARFVMLKDKFGVHWIFNCELKK